MPVVWRDAASVTSANGTLEVVARMGKDSSVRFVPEDGSDDEYFELSLREVVSFLAHPPSPTRRDGHVDINTHRGPISVSFPAKWSGRAFIAAAGNLISVRQSPKDHCLYTITPDFEDDALDKPARKPASLRDLRFNMLSGFSHVTQGARASRDAIFRNPLVHRTIARQANTKSTAAQAGPHMLDARPLGNPNEYDAARVRLARWAHTVAGHAERERQSYTGPPPPPPIGLSEWKTLGEKPAHELAQHVFERGLSADARSVAWPVIFQSAPADDYGGMRDGWLGSSDVMEEHENALSARRIWIDCLRADTRAPIFATPHPEARDRMLRSAWHRAPAAGDSRGDVNPHLFVISEILLTYVLHESSVGGGLEGYVQGMSDLCSLAYVACGGDDVKTFGVFCSVMDRIHPHYALDQQGMRESLILLERLMAELCPALHRHLEELEALNMFFCFRWLLVYFKREFDLDGVLRLWDSLWASEYGGALDVAWPFCRRFELFVALAILESHEGPIVRHLKSSDEVLEYVHELAGHLDVHAVLRRASALVYRLRSRAHSEPALAAPLRNLVEC